MRDMRHAEIAESDLHEVSMFLLLCSMGANGGQVLTS